MINFNSIYPVNPPGDNYFIWTKKRSAFCQRKNKLFYFDIREIELFVVVIALLTS